MPESLKENLLFHDLVGANDGWQTLHWTDWKLAIRDKNLDQYMEKQIKEAVFWYYHKPIEEISGYDASKKIQEQNDEAGKMIAEASLAYITHVDEVSGLKGSENFARKNLMYRNDLPKGGPRESGEIEKRYKEWEEKELHHEEVKALTK